MTAVRSFSMKLVRADEHLKALNDAVRAFLETNPYEIVREVSRGGGSWYARVHRSPPESLGLLIGDCLHNLRSALDHVAWRLAGNSANRQTEFPIFSDKAAFDKKRGGGLWKMHDMPTGAQDIIESLQPYHGQPEREPLWLLQELSIEDKHHALNLVAAAIAEGSIAVRVAPTGWTPTPNGLFGLTNYVTFEGGQEILRVPAADRWQIGGGSSAGPSTQHRDDDEVRFTFDVAFDPKGPGRGKALSKGLRDMREAVADAIRLLEPFLP